MRKAVRAVFGVYALMKPGERGKGDGLRRGYFFRGEPVLIADHRGGEIGWIEMYGHGECF